MKKPKVKKYRVADKTDTQKKLYRKVRKAKDATKKYRKKKRDS